MKTSNTLIIALLSGGVPITASGGFSDVRPKVVSNQLVTDAFDDSTASIVPHVRVFQYRFFNDPEDPYFTQDPGFNAPNNSLPANSTLSYDILSALTYWSGSGAVSWTTPPSEEALQFKLGSAGNTRTITGTSPPQSGAPIGPVNSLGAIHRHLNAFLLGSDGNAIPGDGAEAAAGIYLATINVKVAAGVIDSPPIHLVYGCNVGDEPFNRAVIQMRDTVAPGTNLANVVSSWNSANGGAYATPSNWTGGVPHGVSVQATFGPVITTPSTIQIVSQQIVGTLNFDSTQSYTLTGVGTLSLSMFAGAPAGINVFSGSHTIATPISLSNDLAITVRNASSVMSITSDVHAPSAKIIKSAQGALGTGTLEMKNVRAAGLQIDIGSVRIAASGGESGASRVNTLSLAPQASLDLRDNDMIVSTTPISEVGALIAAARNGGAWDAPGITTSSAADATTLGLISGSDWLAIGNTTFDGFVVSPTDTLVKYTWYGDTDFNGVIDFDDYVRIDNGFNGGLVGWMNGDFDLNGVVDFDDYVLIDLSFNSQTGVLTAVVPEPNFIGGLAALLTLVASRRVTRRHRITARIFRREHEEDRFYSGTCVPVIYVRGF